MSILFRIRQQSFIFSLVTTNLVLAITNNYDSSLLYVETMHGSMCLRDHILTNDIAETLLLCSKNKAHVATFWWGATKHERLLMAPVVYGHPTLMTLEPLIVAPPDEIPTVLTPCWNRESVRLKVVGGAYDLFFLLLCLSFSGSSSSSSTLVE